MEHSGGGEAEVGGAFDVIVIGGGVMGSSAAYQAASRGLRTLLLEQFDFLHQRGSSHGESRTIRATYPEPYYTPLVLESYALWAHFEARFGSRVCFPARHLDMGPRGCRTLRAVIAGCEANRVAFRVMDSAELDGQLSGRLGIPDDWVAVDTEHGGVLKPTKAVHMLQSLARLSGAVLRDNSEVTDVKRDLNGGVSVVTSAGETFHGRKCVVTVGAWTWKLVKTISGVDIPIQPLETALCYWRIKDGHADGYRLVGGAGGSAAAAFPTFASCGDPYIYGTPALEYPELIKVAVHGGRACDPDKREWGPVDEATMEKLREWVRKRFGGRVEAERPVKTQYCMYSMTPDEDFVMDFIGGELGRDVVVGGGFSGHGFKMAPAVGRILVDMATSGGAEGVDLGMFRIGRFEGNPKGNVKDYEDQVNHFVNSLSLSLSLENDNDK